MTTTDACPECLGHGHLHHESGLGRTPCPECDGTGRVAPVAVDVPPGTLLHELAALAADAPEVRRGVVRAPLVVCCNDGDVAIVTTQGTVRMANGEAARRLLAFDALLAAAERVLAGLDERIRAASVCGGTVPLFDGVAALHDAIVAARP